MDTHEPARLLLSYADARAALGGIGRTTLWELINSGDLARVNIGRRGFVTRASIDAYIARLTDQAGQR